MTDKKHSLKIENISDTDYQRLQQEAAEHGVSLRNCVRSKLNITPAKRGNPNAAETGRRTAATRRKRKPKPEPNQ